jgi:eukaryotic-like serine/threonine-protein kinase
VCMKIIQIDNLHDGPQIESFRRGVQSLRYLTNAGVPGTAKLIDAHEIPTAVVMDFVEGQPLSDVASNSHFNFWDQGLPILINVCMHLEYSHNLPQGVLHRDIRPSNIMVPYYFWSDLDAADAKVNRYEAVLLNYDMS